MNRRSLLSLSTITALGFALVPGGVIAQQKSLKDQIVGSWTLVQAIDTHADGTKTNPWGANPKGAYMFGADGRFAQMLFHTDLPKIDNRMGGTPDQNKAIAQGVVAMYGSYTVDEANKTIVVKLEGSSFAKFVGTEGKRVITSIDDYEFRSTNPATSTGTKAESVWRRVR
jgi:lipocalin-like protein